MGRRPIPRWKVERVRALLGQQLTQRSIAEATGLTQPQVSAIARTNPMPSERGEVRGPTRQEAIDAELGVYDFNPQSRPKRCPTCGALCYEPYCGWPCLHCRCQEKKRAHRAAEQLKRERTTQGATR